MPGDASLVATVRAAMDEDGRDPADLPMFLSTCAICRSDFHLRDEGEPCSLCDACAWDALRALCDEVERLGFALTAAERERDEARGRIAYAETMADTAEGARAIAAHKLNLMHRRAQRAEAIADRCVAGRPRTGGSLGRALANYSADRFAEIAMEALDAGTDDAKRELLRARLDALTARAVLPSRP